MKNKIGDRINAALLFVVVVLSGCTTAPPDISVSDTVAVRSPIMRGVASVFMRIENKGGKDHLIGASTNIAGSIVELHDIKDGKMIKVKSIKIPSKSKVELIPKGPHIMIFNLPDEPIHSPSSVKDGFEFTINLKFEKSGQKAVKLKL
jgi:copper(I)-binding protein